MGWIEFAIAMVLFMGSHRIPAAIGVKDGLVRVLGARGYTILFSVLSTLLLLWVIWAAGRAPFVSLWDQTQTARWAVNLVMPLVIVLAVYGVAAPNPFAFEGRSDGFDPQHPGIAGLTRQPLLWALLLWSGAHLWANGDLAHVILFATFAGFSVMGMLVVERRRRKVMGAQAWQALVVRTALIPGVALLTGRWKPHGFPSPLRMLIVVVVWVALWHSHHLVIGVSPSP